MSEPRTISPPERDRARNVIRPAALDRRKHERHPTRLGGCLRLADQGLRYCDIIDVSANGVQIRTAKPLAHTRSIYQKTSQYRRKNQMKNLQLVNLWLNPKNQLFC